MDPNLIILICALTFGGIITLITSFETLSDSSHTWIGRHWKKIGITVCYTALIWITIYQYNQAKSEKEQDKKALVIMQSSSDSTIQAGIDSANRRLFDNLSEALYKQGLKFDSVKNEVTAIKNDTSRKANVYGPDPFVSLCNDSLITILEYPTQSSIRFRLAICNSEAACKNLKLSASIVGEDNDHNLFFLSKHELISNGSMSNGTRSTIRIITGYAPDALKYYFLIKGSYFDVRKTKKFTVDDLYLYDLKTKVAGTVAFQSLDSLVRLKIPK
jgi:hypothetical protein